MKQIAIAAAVAATFAVGSVAQACPNHSSHKSKRVHSRVHSAPQHYYTGNYNYSPGYDYSYGYQQPVYYNNWDTGYYNNSYNNFGIGLGPLSIGF